MSQIGKLSKISIDKILKWAEKGKKTGAFAFTRGEEKKFLYFQNGGILSASSNNPKERLGQVMVRHGKITQQQIEMIQDLQRKEKLKFGKLILREGFASSKDIADALVFQAEEIVVNLFDWDDGEFLFYLNKLPPAEIVNHNYQLDKIITRGLQRKTDWISLKKAIPSFDTVLDISFSVPDQSGEQQLSELEFKIMTLVDGLSSIQDICVMSEFPEYETVKTLLKLLSEGYLSRKDDAMMGLDFGDDLSSDSGDLDDDDENDEEVGEEATDGPDTETVQLRKRIEACFASGELKEVRNSLRPFFDASELSDGQREILTSAQLSIAALENIPVLIDGSNEENLKKFSLDHRAGFLLSRIDGKLNIKLLSNISGFPKDQVQEIIFNLFMLGILEIVMKSSEEKLSKNIAGQGGDKRDDHLDGKEDIREIVLDKYQHIAQQDYYEILGVDKNVEAADLKKAFHGVAKQFHPDMVQTANDAEILKLANVIFDKIQLAYDTLSDTEKRSNYDRAKGLNLTEEEQRKIARLKAKAGLQYQIGMKAFKARNYKKAMEFIKSAIDINPHDAIYYGILGEIQSKNPKWFNLAIENLEKAINLDPHNPMFYVTMGSIFVEEGKTDDAANFFQKALFYDSANEAAIAELKKIGREVQRAEHNPFDKIITKDIALR